ncbi:MAG TPA: SagB/ThcOx family dehydrogenase [Gemmataceae bacterium]|nr:SagB/ThcOx family dehydrogenase [Gemmataceae bacterium]
MNDATGKPAFEDAVGCILHYHQQTKHHLHQYARSAGYLDWANQPDPFRTFAGAPRIDLPLGDVATPYDDLYRPGAVPSRPLDLGNLGIFFELALGLSAWKQYQNSRWALRCNPSSGNLHPTEGYAILPALPGVEAGVYHYVSRDHCLERRCTLSGTEATPLDGGLLPQGSFFVGLTSIHWREAWKYGERAYRYCQHDAGHALATLRLAAGVLGWSAHLVDSIADGDLAVLLGVDRLDDFAQVAPPDREQPNALLFVQPAQRARNATQDLMSLVQPALALLRDGARHGTWSGQANALSRSHEDWSIIEEAAEAAGKPATTLAQIPTLPGLPPVPSSSSVPAAQIVRQRRSCLALDGTTFIPAETFYRMLDHLLPRPQVAPWDMLPWEPLVQLALFVHRIVGLPPGLYLFERSAAVHERLRAAVKAEVAWEPLPGCPEHVRLFFLAPGDCRRTAGVISCHQDIAADGAFSLGMIADFGDTIRQRGPWWYRRLFWEAGAVGQVLYLEAEAAGIRSTGIGCYFDDACHKVLGLDSDRFQSLYHFTVGAPVDDPRLTTLPAYGHLRRAHKGQTA